MPVQGVAFRVESPGIRKVIRELQTEVGVKTRKAKRIIGNESVERLRQERSRVYMNRDTGLMRKSYRFNVRRHSTQIDIFNLARSKGGYPYPKKIEELYRPVERTIRKEKSRIIRNTNLELRRPERSNLYLNELVR